MAFAQDKARDAISFDPFQSKWITVDDTSGIFIRVRYSESLSNLLRKLPGARWEADAKQWRYPFTSGDAIRAAIPNIERLAALAQESAERETATRDRLRAHLEQQRRAEKTESDKHKAHSLPRPLQQRYLHPLPGRPRFVKALEAIGDDARQYGFPARCWIAQIFGADGHGGWARAFVHGVKDYSSANSKGSRGIAVTFFLEEGPIYEVSSPLSWKSIDRYFLRIVDGSPLRMAKSEVEECLAK